MTLKPKKLHKGDKVALIAPSGYAKPEKINKAIDNIKRLGLDIVYSETIFKRYGYLAGSDNERLADLHEAFENNEVKAIFCIRGGYGATRIIDRINYDLIRKNPKIFVGFSDITALHTAFYTKTGLVGIHGIVGASEFSEYTLQQLNDLLFDSLQNYSLSCQWNDIIVHGGAKGTSIGGNLSLLVSLIGTEFLPDFKDKIVFIEEIAEPPYKIDRMLTHLQNATNLCDAQALIFGSFYKCEPEDFNMTSVETFTVKQIISEKFSDFQKPLLFGLNFGHIPNACIFPIGVEMCVNTEMKEIFVLENIVN
jgi:muramoyltetrapeptide carboxypeptidase